MGRLTQENPVSGPSAPHPPEGEGRENGAGDSETNIGPDGDTSRLSVNIRLVEEYVAPFTPYEGGEPPLRPNYYMVTLKKGHTLQKHFDAVGERLKVHDEKGWYSARLSDD